jgi:hypothetical protein
MYNNLLRIIFNNVMQFHSFFLFCVYERATRAEARGARAYLDGKPSFELSRHVYSTVNARAQEVIS